MNTSTIVKIFISTMLIFSGCSGSQPKKKVDPNVDAGGTTTSGTTTGGTTTGGTRTSTPDTGSTSSRTTGAATDGGIPTVLSVTSSKANGSYKVGAEVAVTIIFSEVVTVTGTPQLTLETGSTDAVINYFSGTGTAALTFKYIIASGDTSADLDYVATTSLALNSGAIIDSDLIPATLTLPSPGGANSLGNSKALVIDTTAPTITYTSISPTSPGASQTPAVTLSLSEASGTSGLGLYSESGCTTSIATAVTGTSGSNAVTTTTLASGSTTTIYAKATDVAGNESSCTSMVSYTHSAGGGAAVPTLSYASSTGTTGTVNNAMSVTPSTLANNGASVTACAIKSSTTALPSGLSVNASTCVISGTPTAVLASTTYTLKATNSVGASADATVSLIINGGVPTLIYSGATGTIGVVNSAMSISPTTLSDNGSAITDCHIKIPTTALPDTLSVNATTCVISGTPTAALSSTSYTLVATNSAGTSTDATVSLSVAAAVPALIYSGATGTSGAIGSAMSVSPTTLSSNGASITACGIKASTTALPTGLSVNASTCVISGTPSATASAVTYTLVATNSAGTSADATVQLTINGVPTLSYASATGTTGAVGTAMSVTPSTLTTNGSSISACGIKSGTTALPTGLTVNATTCVISGTPTQAVSATTYTLNATNSAGASADATLSITVANPPPMVSGLAMTDTDADVGQIAGNLIIKKADDESLVTDYVVYWGSDPYTKQSGTEITRIAKTGSSLLYYIFAANTAVPSVATHILVFTSGASGESGNAASITIDNNQIMTSSVTPGQFQVTIQPGASGNDADVVASESTTAHNSGYMGSGNHLVNPAYELLPFMSFDLSNLPASAVIAGAHLDLYHYTVAGVAGAMMTELRALTSSFAEATVTYATKPSWSATNLGSATFPATPAGWVTWGTGSSAMLTQINSAIASASHVAGFTLVQTTNNNWVDHRVYSSEDIDSTRRPRLVIDYTDVTHMVASTLNVTLLLANNMVEGQSNITTTNSNDNLWWKDANDALVSYGSENIPIGSVVITGLSTSYTYKIQVYGKSVGTQANLYTAVDANSSALVTLPLDSWGWVDIGTVTGASQTTAYIDTPGTMGADRHIKYVRAIPQIKTYVDNADAGFALTGAWTSNAEGAYGTVVYKLNGNGSAFATWTFSSLPPGQYRVSATWTPHAELRATNAPYTVYNGATSLGTVLINQRNAPSGESLGGITYTSLGNFTITDSNSLVVKLTNDADNYVLADAVMVEYLGPASPVAPAYPFFKSAIDNGDAGYAVTGTWSPLVEGAYSDCAYAIGGSGSNSATWTFSSLEPGQYRVSATWSTDPNRATNAPYTVYNGATSLGTVLINQEKAPGGEGLGGINYTSLGIFTITGSNSLVVKLTDAANQYVIADAVMIERVTLQQPIMIDNGLTGYASSGMTVDGLPSGCVNNTCDYAGGNAGGWATWTFDGIAAGQYRVYAMWKPLSNRAINAPYTVYNGATSLATVAKNQVLSPDGLSYAGYMWETIGIYTITSGNSLKVQLNTSGLNSATYVIADSILIEPLVP